MSSTARDAYFTNEVMTATPQKLHLMLIDAAIRLANQTLEHWRQGREGAAVDSMVRCQHILVEMLKGLRPNWMPELVAQVTRVYLFVYRNVVLAQAQRDPARLNDAIRVLEIERETWRLVCEKLGGESAPNNVPAPHAVASRRLILEA